METQEQEASAETKEDKPFVLAPARKALRKGIPTTGMLVFSGLAKSGKTAIAASMPGAVILELEQDGAAHLDGWVQEIDSLSTFRKAYKASVQSAEAKIIVIDTLDELLKWVEEDVAGDYGLSSMSDRKEGVNGFSVWRELGKRVDAMVKSFKNCGKLVVLLAHYKEPKLDSEGRVVVTQAINAPGKVGSYFAGQADLIGHCYKNKVSGAMQYSVSFVGGGVLGAYGGRVDELEGKTVVLPKGAQWEAIHKAAAAAPASEPALEKKTDKTKKGGK